jgi:hypothetical protein
MANQKTMKNLRNLLILILISVIVLPSCKKDLVEKFEQNKTTEKVIAKNTSEVKAPENFKWSTSRTIKLTANGIVGDARVSVLRVEATDGTVLFTKLQKVKESVDLTLEVPARYEKVNVVFGGMQKTYDTKSGKAELTFN